MAALDRKATHLLILDDDSDSRFFLRSNLVRAGFGEVHTTGDPHTAMTYLQKHKVSAVLVSSESKSAGGGLAFVKELRGKASPNATIPILLVVPSGDANILQQGIHDGVNDFVVRPISLSGLLKRVEKACLNRSITPSREVLSKLDRRNGSSRRSGKPRRLEGDSASGQQEENRRSESERREKGRREVDRQRNKARAERAAREKEKDRKSVV